MFHSFAVKRIFIPGRICFSTQKIAVQSLLLGVVGQSVTCKQSVWKSHTISPKTLHNFLCSTNLCFVLMKIPRIKNQSQCNYPHYIFEPLAHSSPKLFMYQTVYADCQTLCFATKQEMGPKL